MDREASLCPDHSDTEQGPPLTAQASRRARAHIGAYLDIDFRRRLRMVQAQTDRDIQSILAEALNDLFKKYHVSQDR
jgi:hypothetical protein